MTLIARLMGRVDRDASGCWLWTGEIIWNGYGRLSIGGQRVLAHRATYEALIAPIPDGLQIDHLCRNRACVNPAHLEPVTASENTRRGNGPGGQHARQTHCVNGHEFTPENTLARNDKGWRKCRECTNARRRKAAL